MEQKIDFSDFEFAILPELKAGETLILKFPTGDKYPVDEIVNIFQHLQNFYADKGVDVVGIPKEFDLIKKE